MIQILILIILIIIYFCWRISRANKDDMPDYLEEDDSGSGWSGFFGE